MQVQDHVPEDDLDYDEIFRRGGANLGDEDFALSKCPECGRILLIDYEVDTLYVDPEDLKVRIDLPVADWKYACAGCGTLFPGDIPWIGANALPEMQVTWSDLEGSAWSWITNRTRRTKE